MIAKSGQKFECASKLFGHASHNGSNYLNGHCFVSLMLCVPVWKKNCIIYQSVPIGYRMWTKEISKLEPAVNMVCTIMPGLAQKHQVLLLFDSWYAKAPLVRLANKYKSLDIICNARYDSAIYDLPQAPTGKRDRPAKRGRRLSLMEDFSLSAEKTGDYYIGICKVLTNIFGDRYVHAYVTPHSILSVPRTFCFRNMMFQFFSAAGTVFLFHHIYAWYHSHISCNPKVSFHRILGTEKSLRLPIPLLGSVTRA